MNTDDDQGDETLTALWDQADDDGQFHTETLPPAIVEHMQRLVDGAVGCCEHVAAAADLPPGVQDKLVVAGVPLVGCEGDVLCLMQLLDQARRHRLIVDSTCVMCRTPIVAHLTRFRDDAAGLTLVAYLCERCVRDELAAWAGVPR